MNQEKFKKINKRVFSRDGVLNEDVGYIQNLRISMD